MAKILNKNGKFNKSRKGGKELAQMDAAGGLLLSLVWNIGILLPFNLLKIMFTLFWEIIKILPKTITFIFILIKTIIIFPFKLFKKK